MAAGRLFLPGFMPALDSDGAPIPDARAYFYLNNTSTLASVYSDEELSIPLTNPVLANSSGRFPAIWASDAVTYSWSIAAASMPPGIPFTGDDLSVSIGTEILVAEAAEAAALDAAASAAAALVSENASEAAYQEILDLAASSPEAPSIVNKLNRNADNADAAILTNLPYLDGATGSVQRPAYEKLKDWLFAGDFEVAADGTDQTANLTDAINAAIASGRPLMLPAGTIRVNSPIVVALGNYPVWQPAFSTGLVIMGVGQGITVIDSRVVGGYWLSIDSTNPHTSTFQAVLGGYVGKMTIRNGVPLANSSGIKIRACFQFLFEDLQIFDMSGTGFKVECSQGDLDGSVHVILNRCRIERCDVWCIDAAAQGIHNEIGAVAIIDSFIQYGGLDETKAITGITQATTAVVTAPNHGFVNGAKVYIGGVQGMTQIDSFLANTAYTVANATTNTLELRNFADSAGINSTGFTAFTLRTATVTAITQASPGVVTANAHGFAENEIILLSGVGGMTDVNGVYYQARGVTANTFQLFTHTGVAVNTAVYPAYTSGGTAAPPAPRLVPRDPKSGGVKWKGQQLRIINGGAVICNNASLYIPGGSGLAQDVVLQNFTIENPGGIGVLITGCRNIYANIFHVYSNQSFVPPNYAGWLLDGQSHQVSNVIIDQPLVRATAAESSYTYFAQFGAFADTQTNRVRNVDYKQSDFLGHRRFSGFQFDPVDEQCQLVLTAATNVRLAPTDKGNFTAGRRSAPVVGTVPSTTGEVIAVATPATGYNQPNLLVGGGALAINTTYNVYLYDATNTLGRWALDINTAAPVYDNVVGKPVMTGDATRIWKGRVRTDAAAQFVITDTSWLNPETIPAGTTGAQATRWTLAGNGWQVVKTTAGLPTSNVAGNFFYKPTLEESVVFDPPSVPANSFIQADVTLTAHAAADHIISVSRTGGWGDLGVAWTTKAANTMRLTLFNGTGSAIDLASAAILVEKLKR